MIFLQFGLIIAISIFQILGTFLQSGPLYIKTFTLFKSYEFFYNLVQSTAFKL